MLTTCFYLCVDFLIDFSWPRLIRMAPADHPQSNTNKTRINSMNTNICCRVSLVPFRFKRKERKESQRGSKESPEGTYRIGANISISDSMGSLTAVMMKRFVVLQWIQPILPLSFEEKGGKRKSRIVRHLRSIDASMQYLHLFHRFFRLCVGRRVSFHLNWQFLVTSYLDRSNESGTINSRNKKKKQKIKAKEEAETNQLGNKRMKRRDGQNINRSVHRFIDL